MAKQQIVRGHVKGRAEARKGMCINLLVTIGTNALDGVTAEAGFANEVINGPLPAEALELDIAAVVGQHLHLHLRLDCAGHQRWDATRHIMQYAGKLVSRFRTEACPCPRGGF